MKLAARTVLVTLILATGAALGVLATGGSHPGEVRVPVPETPAPEAPGGAKGRAVGMSGCLATACHGAPAGKVLGGNIDATCWQSSGGAWVAADPHTAAYSLLTDAPLRPVAVAAKEIMARYAPGTKATEDARCLACHSNPTLANEPYADARVQTLRSEGVGCESCHGNAGGWVREHTTWKGARKDVYAATGMTLLYDIGERAVTCAGCHVGAPAEGGRAVRDMNHDMIAAGHPRLNFDFAEYLRRLPPHWQEKDRTADGYKSRGSEFPAKAWLVGRVAHAEAACKLLADRAARAKAGDALSPWPEFAEFNCAACHHDIPDPCRDGDHLGTRRPGSLPWQTIWPVTRPGAEEFPAVAQLLSVLEGPRPPGYKKLLEPEQSKDQPAGKAADALAGFRKNLVTMPDGEVLALALCQFPPALPGRLDWDSAGQMLYGLAALQRARPGAPSPSFTDAFEAARGRNWGRAHSDLRVLHRELIPAPKMP